MKRPSIVVFLLFISFLFASAGEKLLTNHLVHGTGTFRTSGVGDVRWLDHGKAYSFQRYDTAAHAEAIYRYTVANATVTKIVDGTMLTLKGEEEPFRFTSYQWSPDENALLFVSAPPRQQYLSRRTPAGNLYIYDLLTKSFRQLTNVEEPQYNPKFSPDGSRIGFVRENNIYVADVRTGALTQVTRDGTEHVINGKFDWVYEEEFGIADGWQWSPDGSRIAYWQLDENRVPEFHMVDFMTIRCDVITMRYPKAGDPNSIVRIGVVPLSTGKTTWMDLGANDDIYIPRIQWFPDGRSLAIQRLNRLQNHLDVLAADPETGATRTLFAEDEKTWIEEKYELQILKDGKHFLWISERDGFAHIYEIDATGAVVRQLTRGTWEVNDIVGVDEKAGRVYFTATIRTPLEAQLCAVTLKGGDPVQLTENGFTHAVNLAPGGAVCLDTYSSATVPPRTALMRTDGRAIRVVKDNPLPVLKDYALGSFEFFTFATSDSVPLNGWMLKPSGFDPAKKYPVLFSVYGGPNSQTVTNAWSTGGNMWNQLMAEKGYIIVSVDGRGTGERGKAFRSIVYRQLGTWEVHDQIEAAKYMGTLPYVDTTRIGIWGWSYGGYMAALTILKGADVFKCAVAVAPVTSWKFYDTIYTERYMGLPKDNEEGYRDSSPITYADQLKGHLLIIHGTTDDNVHWQNTAQLVDALQKAGKQFQTTFYVNKNHGIAGGNTREQLFDTITDYLLANL